ncbi:bifunctional nicotinamidase/pyrazinamidase [Pedosphaera parvula]|uniref:Nicotinamidase n=1 Tax=Pedosphaera parvula (strain Ellin514) TaxID=320771 RepID=B9XNB1_PEDPL|nr:bifunctional nicotinamidase/pyrazinamidase [Pedosphaera parvula]EEF58664.1 Nicotinamidase [Pedosphaera parvula Ellin514]
MKALILVDLQNDFLPGGALAVPHGDTVLPLANKLQSSFKLILATQDWHPINHSSFAVNHPGRTPGETVVLKKRQQKLWPVHCVQNTRGAEITTGLMMNKVNKVFKKGVDVEIDSHSGFFDNDHQRSTGLGEYLKEKKVKEVYILGLATDYCVKATALDAVALGFKTHLIEDACRGVNETDSKSAIEEMRKAGVEITKTSVVLNPPKKK